MFAERSQVVITELKENSTPDLIDDGRARPAKHVNTQQDCLLFGTADERTIVPLTIKVQPDKTNLAQIQQQFGQQASSSQAIEVGIKQYSASPEVRS